MTEAKHTPGPWQWADEPGAGIQIRGPYQESTRLLFSDIWRQFPERKWDAEMEKNAQLAASSPDLLTALRDCVAVMENDLKGLAVIAPELAQARAAIKKATG